MWNRESSMSREHFGRDDQQSESSTCDDARNHCRSQPCDDALVSQVVQQGLEALRARLAEVTAPSQQRLSIPEATFSQQEMM